MNSELAHLASSVAKICRTGSTSMTDKVSEIRKAGIIARIIKNLRVNREAFLFVSSFSNGRIFVSF